MPRYALKIEYDGAPFVGWQRQQSQVSVQGSIEKALSNLENKEHTIAGAGRTDAGVHAKCQVCLLYTSPSPRDRQKSRMPSSA